MLWRFPSCRKQIKYTIHSAGSYNNTMLSGKKMWIFWSRVSVNTVMSLILTFESEYGNRSVPPPPGGCWEGQEWVMSWREGENRSKLKQGRSDRFKDSVGNSFRVEMPQFCCLGSKTEMTYWHFMFSLLFACLSSSSFTTCHYDSWPLEAIPGGLNYKPQHLASLNRVF